MNLESNKPTITVLMSCYNAERWLEVCIDSIISQTYDDFEFIIVNDGSTDSTTNILKKYAVADSRIILIEKANTGLADSLNTGIRNAKGVWIARIDADDVSMPHRFEKQLEVAQKNKNLGLIGSWFVEIDENGLEIKKQRYPHEHDKLVRNLEKSKRFFPHSSAIFKTELVKSCGGYNQRFKRAEDLDLWHKLSEVSKISCIPDVLVKIRKHYGQISRDFNGTIQAIDSHAATVCHFLRKYNINDPSKQHKDEWDFFRNWVVSEITRDNYINRKAIWGRARDTFIESNNIVIGVLRFHLELFKTSQCFPIIYEKIFGSRLSKKIAEKWIVYQKSKI